MTTVTDRDSILAGNSSEDASLALESEFLDHFGPQLRFVAPVDRRLQCIFCERLCVECWRAACGHSVCATCLDEISNGGSKCPDDGVLVTTLTVFKCPEVESEVKNLVTRCPNHDINKCDDHLALHRLKEHLRRCSEELVSCPQRCGASVRSSQLRVHTRQQCPRSPLRPTTASDGSVTTSAKFDSLLSTSGGGPLGLQVTLPVSSRSCSPLGGAGADTPAAIYAAYEHRKQVELLRDAMLTLELRMDRMLRLVKDEIGEMQDAYSGLKNKLGARVEEIHTTVAQQGNEVDKLSAKLREMGRRVEALTLASTAAATDRERRISTNNDLLWPTPTAANCQGVFLWRLHDYARVSQESGGPHRADVLSTPFLSDSYGYRMCLALDPNGDGSGKGTHISVYVCLMRGPYDDVLSWPFQQRVTFTLMDQRDCRDKNHVTQVLVPDPSWPEFKRPTGEKNLGRGFHKFVPKAVLESSDTYLRNDTLYIKVTVDDEIQL